MGFETLLSSGNARRSDLDDRIAEISSEFKDQLGIPSEEFRTYV